MAVLIWSSTAALAAWLIHFLIWRIRVPKYQTKALLLIYFGTAAAGVVWSALGPTRRFGIAPLSGAAQYVQFALFVIAAALAYIITYSGFEVDSPTLVMIHEIHRFGKQGVPVEQFERDVSDDRLIAPRVRDLVRDRMIVHANGRYTLTPKGCRFVGIFICYRKLTGVGKGG